MLGSQVEPRKSYLRKKCESVRNLAGQALNRLSSRTGATTASGAVRDLRCVEDRQRIALDMLIGEV
jgi:hypothetical protein